MLWLVAILLVVIGLVGTIVPALPGPILVFTGLLVAAWADGFTRIGVLTLIVLAVLTVAAYAVDFAASAVGVRRAGASTRAAVGAALGALAGIFFGLPGLILGPFVGAVLGELTVRRNLPLAGRAGLAAWIGFVVGTAVKLALVFGMIGLAALAFAVNRG
jgi:uncharacterized protein YqgC (DUF456 family)